MERSETIVLTMFGTTVDSGLRGLLAIRDTVARTWPQTAVHLAFTSKRVRTLWRERAALVYMGHGSRHFPIGGLYLEFAACMRALYPDLLTLIGTVDGFPPLDTVVGELRRHKVERVVPKPLLIASGMHATRDLTGPGESSWQLVLAAAGFTTVVVSAGLGEHPAFVEHIADAAAAASLELA